MREGGGGRCLRANSSGAGRKVSKIYKNNISSAPHRWSVDVTEPAGVCA